MSWGFTVFGRLISMMSDRGNTLYNWIWVIVELALAAGPLLFAFGFVAWGGQALLECIDL